MTTPEDLELLAAIHDRSPEGVGVAVDTVRELGDGVEPSLHRLLQEGLLEHVGERTVRVTDAGRDVLAPRNSE